MFQSFVTGPVGLGRPGLIGRCVECATRRIACGGFGAGCLVSRPCEKEEDPPCVQLRAAAGY